MVKIRPLTQKDHARSFRTFLNGTAKTEHHQLFSIGRLMYADYKTEIIFAVVEETLIW